MHSAGKAQAFSSREEADGMMAVIALVLGIVVGGVWSRSARPGGYADRVFDWFEDKLFVTIAGFFSDPKDGDR